MVGAGRHNLDGIMVPTVGYKNVNFGFHTCLLADTITCVSSILFTITYINTSTGNLLHKDIIEYNSGPFNELSGTNFCKLRKFSI